MSDFSTAARSRLAILSASAGQTSDAYGGTYPVRLVALDEIEPHPDNRDIDAAHVDRLADDIAEIGLGQYVLVRPLPGDPSRYQCIVGHHRVEAFRLLAARDPQGPWGSIPAVVCDFDDERAERMLIDSNLHSRPLSREELGREMLKLKPAADRRRAEQPERYRGARTAEIMRDIYNEGAPDAGKISTRTVERSVRAARAASRPKPAARSASRPKPAARAVSLAGATVARAARRLEDAVSALETAGLSPQPGKADRIAADAARVAELSARLSAMAEGGDGR